MAVVWILTVFFFAAIAGAVESASQYRPICSDGGYKNTHDIERDGKGNPLSSYPENYSISYNGSLNVKYWLLRFYIPPVANGSINLALFCTQTASIGAVARLGAPPQCDLFTYTNSEAIADSTFIGLAWDSCATSLQQLRDRDWRVKNKGGSLDVVSDVNGSSKGEWLYVKVLFNGTSIKSVGLVNFSVQVPLTDYVTWYDGVKWDSSGNPPLDVNNSIGTGSCDFGSGGGEPIDGSSYVITVASQGAGNIYPGGSPSVKQGGSESFIFMAMPGYHVESVKHGPANGVMVNEGGVSVYTFSNVREDMRLEVVFQKGDAPAPVTPTNYTINVDTTGQGTVSPAGPYSVEEGENQTFNFSPASNWEVARVGYRHSGDASYTYVGARNRYTFENVNAEMDLFVEFSEIKSIVYEYDANSNFPTYDIDGIGDGTLIFKPTLNFPSPPADQVYCYVGYWSQGRLFLAREELDGKVVFELYYPNSEITPETFEPGKYTEWIPFLRYGAHDFNGGTAWECDLFDKVEFKSDLVSGNGVTFLIGISAVGESVPSQGAFFTFSP